MARVRDTAASVILPTPTEAALSQLRLGKKSNVKDAFKCSDTFPILSRDCSEGRLASIVETTPLQEELIRVTHDALEGRQSSRLVLRTPKTCTAPVPLKRKKVNDIDQAYR